MSLSGLSEQTRVEIGVIREHNRRCGEHAHQVIVDLRPGWSLLAPEVCPREAMDSCGLRWYSFVLPAC